jgi:hypothetical protein
MRNKDKVFPLKSQGGKLKLFLCPHTQADAAVHASFVREVFCIRHFHFAHTAKKIDFSVECQNEADFIITILNNPRAFRQSDCVNVFVGSVASSLLSEINQNLRLDLAVFWSEKKVFAIVCIVSTGYDARLEGLDRIVRLVDKSLFSLKNPLASASFSPIAVFDTFVCSFVCDLYAFHGCNF